MLQAATHTVKTSTRIKPGGYYEHCSEATARAGDIFVTHAYEGAMAIDWYPGHMVTAKKNAAVAMRKTDVVIEVLDARVPAASLNPIVEKLRREHQRPTLKVLNKADLADPALTAEWLRYYNAQPATHAIALTAQKAADVKRVAKEAATLAGKTKPLRMLILGVPNAGKSTLMNTLLGRHISKVGDEPAITKMQLRHELASGVWLTDTPGMLWPGVGEDAGLKLAAANSIGRNAYDETEVAAWLAGVLLERYRALLEKRYGGSVEATDGDGVLAWIVRRRSFAQKDAMTRAASTLLNDFRSGTLGRITLERPA